MTRQDLQKEFDELWNEKTDLECIIVDDEFVQAIEVPPTPDNEVLIRIIL